MWSQINNVASYVGQKVEGLEELIQSMQQQLDEQKQTIQQMQQERGATTSVQGTGPTQEATPIANLTVLSPGSQEHFKQAANERVQMLLEQGKSEESVYKQMTEETHHATAEAIAAYQASRHQQQQQAQENLAAVQGGH